MGVRPGYKQTAVGVIPEEWNTHRLGELLQGPRSIRYGIVQPGRFDATGCYMLRSQDYSKGWAGPDGMHKVSAQLENQYRNARIQHDDLVITVVGAGIGQVVVVPQWLDGAILSRSTARVAIDEDKAARSFVRAFLEGPLGKRQILDCQKEGAQPVVSCIDLARFFVAYPPLPEQRAIAGALSDVDGLLGGLDQLIAKKRDLKQAAMQQLLTGQTRLPGFAPEKPSFKQTEVGVIPDDWKLTQLVELVDPSRGIRYGIVQPGNYDPQGRYMIRGQDYSEVKGWAKPTDIFRVSPGVEERYRNSRVKAGDLIMTIVGYCGHVEITPEWLNGANLTQTTARLAIQPDKAVSTFCKYMLLSPIGRHQVAAYMKGAAQPGLNCGDVEKFLIPIPSFPEQTAIAEVLSEMDEELAVLEQRREKIHALKQAMMQELLTGRIRLLTKL